MTRAEKIKQTAIEKYGSWEQYKLYRYSPDKMKHIPEASKKGGKATAKSPNAVRPFRDVPGSASEAGKKRWNND